MVAAPTGRPRVALSFVGAHSRVAELPWIHGAPRVAASFGEPNGPDGVSLNVTEMADRHHVTVSYYAEQFPRGGVAAAVEGFLNDPASYLLDAAETTRV